MSINSRRFLLASGLLGAAMAFAGPVFAQHGGGGHGGGGGGHVGGGGGAHFGGGVGGGHASAGHFAGPSHFGGGAHYSPGFTGGHYAGGVSRSYSGSTVAHSYIGGRAAYAAPGGGYYRHGYSTGAYWGGGYWRGGYWPRAYYGWGYSWFLPILPLAYATYWYSGVPYYYANDVYYTWNPQYEGYTVTDPPPVTDSSGGAEGAAANVGEAGGSAGQIFMYPKNGQSEEQQSIDKRECQQWAASQAGAANSVDYRRAMMACVEGRGYSAN